MIFEPFDAFVASEFRIKFATTAWERRQAAGLRREVFCREQGLFDGDDTDEIDRTAIPLVALSMLGVAADAVVGTVRIHDAGRGTWWGARLAVAADHRRIATLGTSLIRLAVCSAHARGCTRFLAHVQVQNELLFRRLNWRPLEELELFGKPHLRMEADLAHYPPFASAETGFQALPRKAA